MAQLNITLNQEEIQQLLSENSGEAFKKILKESLNSIMKAESAEQLQAAPYERTDERRDSRNGTRERTLNTRIGSITLQVPRHRNQPFKTMVFENYKRSETALIAGMAEMVVNGISTRKVTKVMETLCDTSFSKSTVSEVCKELEKYVEEFRNRPLDGRYPFLTLDATYFKVRENHRIISKSLMIAYATNEQGHREVIGFDVYEKESKNTWSAFVEGLKKRGLRGLLMITSDAHDGILYAIAQNYPFVPWQRCQFHFSKNISEKAPKKYQAGIRAELNDMFNCDNIEDARKKRDAIIDEYKDVAETAMRCLDEGFESSMTCMVLPKSLRKIYRTSNQIERLNEELKRRSRVIGIFPNSTSLLRLMGSVLIEQDERVRNRKAVFSTKTYAALIASDAPTKLSKIAEEQVLLSAA